MGLHLGIDTSAYTTSVAVYDDEAQQYIQRRTVLAVKAGERGLRQSDAVFQHLKNLPTLLEQFSLEYGRLSSVNVSNAPRRVEGSYMPVFMVGQGFARAIASALNLPLRCFSHQEGHVAAALYGLSPQPQKFFAVHMSGGTTELLLVEMQNGGLNIEKIGGTMDLHFGQLVDRIGVGLGYSFPCGKEMDSGVAERETPIPVKILPDFSFNISGLENKISDMPEERQISVLFHTIADILIRWLDNARKNYGNYPTVISGGVAANSTIRSVFEEREDVFFAPRELSTDNAVGIAMLGGSFS